MIQHDTVRSPYSNRAPLLYSSFTGFELDDTLTLEKARLGSGAMQLVFEKIEREGLLDRSRILPY